MIIMQGLDSQKGQTAEMRKEMDKVSVVLPTLCDDENVARIRPRLNALCAVDEIIVDNTIGLGRAVGHGIDRARNGIVAVMDCDGLHPVETLEKMIRAYHNTQDGTQTVLVSGSRLNWPGDARGIVSFLGNWLARILLRLKVRDCTTGFFVGSKDALVQLPVWSGYGDFAIALHYEAKRRSWEVTEVPFHYGLREAGRTHTKLVRHSLQYLLRIWSLLLRECRGEGWQASSVNAANRTQETKVGRTSAVDLPTKPKCNLLR